MRWLALLFSSLIGLASAQAAAPVILLTQKGAIGPASADYLHRGLARASAAGAQLVVIAIDTPGGLDSSMRAIIQDILASPVPVAAFVAPAGARAASAGTYILYASHVAAMAPATNLGAATPVAIGGQGGGESSDESGGASGGKSRGGPGAAPDKPADADAPASTARTLARKQRQDAAAYIRALAQLRGRNAEWAEKAVREAASLSAEEARQLGVVDLIVADVPQLLQRLEGRRLQVRGGEVTLATAGATVIDDPPDWRTRLLAVITEPEVAYILLMIGIYGLLFEFYSPGMIAPGVVGTICLLTAMFAFQMLPVSIAGLALMVTGIGLLVAEHFVAGFGVLGFGGIAAFAIGSLMLVGPGAGGRGIAWPLVAAATVLLGALLMAALAVALRARRRPVVSGREAMIGATGEIVDPGGAIARIGGELWKVQCGDPLERGRRVRVTAVEGLVLAVEGLSTGEAK